MEKRGVSNVIEDSDYRLPSRFGPKVREARLRALPGERSANSMKGGRSKSTTAS